MLNETQINEMWMLFADYIEKKQLDIVAERYIDMLADFGVPDRIFQSATGNDSIIDRAITYYLETEDESSEDDDDYNELDF